MAEEQAVQKWEKGETSVFLPEMSIDIAVQRRDAIIQFTRRIMNENQDFGVIPGTKKPTLLKPGAEKLCSFFGLEPIPITIESEKDWTGERHGGEPFFFIRYQCLLKKNGKTLGAGEGSANSWESKYRYRWVSRDEVPQHLVVSNLPTRGGTIHEFAFAITKGETGGKYGKPMSYWQMWRTAITSGTARQVTKTTNTGKVIEAWEMDSTTYRIPNPDVFDLVNTIEKMAWKRALIAASLIATSASEFYTQDVEDAIEEAHAASPAPTPQPTPEKPASAPAEAAKPNRLVTRKDFEAIKAEFAKYGATGTKEYDIIVTKHGGSVGGFPAKASQAGPCYAALSETLGKLQALDIEPEYVDAEVMPEEH